MSNYYDSKKHGSNKSFQYINQVSINGKSLEVVVQTNNPFKYALHRFIGSLSLARGRSYRYRG